MAALKTEAARLSISVDELQTISETDVSNRAAAIEICAQNARGATGP
jgi:hypothetical protein